MCCRRRNVADRAQHDHAHAPVLVERLENQSQLIALRHLDHVERRPVEDDVGAGARLASIDAKAVELGKPGSPKVIPVTSMLAVPCMA